MSIRIDREEILKYLFFVYAYMCDTNSVRLTVGDCRGPNRALNPLELKLQLVVSYLRWVLETELRFSERSVKVNSH